MTQEPTPAPADETNRILLVDDDATNLDVLRQTLEGHGYRLFFARSGEDALKVARRARPLTDPAGRRHAGHRRLRNLPAPQGRPETRDAAVIFLSALDDAERQGARVRGRRRGLRHEAVSGRRGARARPHTSEHPASAAAPARGRSAITPRRRRRGERTPSAGPSRRATARASDAVAGGRARTAPCSAPVTSSPTASASSATSPKGGMGELYEAEDLELHERVALKTILSSIADDERSILLFKREVHLARQVTHAERLPDLRCLPPPSRAATGSRRRSRVSGHGVAARRNAGRPARAGWAVVDRRRASHRAADGGRPRGRASCRGRAPRLQEPQRDARRADAADPETAGGDHGFRAGAAQRAGRRSQACPCPC